MTPALLGLCLGLGLATATAAAAPAEDGSTAETEAPPGPPAPDLRPDLSVLTDPAAARAELERYRQFVSRVGARPLPVPRPEAPWRFAADIHEELLPLALERPGVIQPIRVGRSVNERPIWGFVIRDPGGPPVTQRLLVFAQIHPLEWIGAEVATDWLHELFDDPPAGVEIWLIPILNVDGRQTVEQDLLAGRNLYRRGNANHVDLNRDFEVNRSSEALWRHIIPRRYGTSPAPLSQPESRAIDHLAGVVHFDASVSLHAFGGYIYYPWAGRFQRPPDYQELDRLGHIMAAGQGARGYTVLELSRWGFFFRGLGLELDHLYGKYGTKAFLIELTRSGIQPLHPATWRSQFRLYNPADPRRHAALGVGALRALAHELERQATTARPSPSR